MVKKLRLAIFIGPFLLLGVWITAAPGAGAQAAVEPAAAAISVPVIQFNHPIYGADFVISLFGAPPRSAVVFYRAEADGTYPEEMGRGMTDNYGNGSLTYTLADPAWVDRDLIVWAEIRPASGPPVATDRMQIKASNPSFYLPCAAADGTGFIARYDEVAGVVQERVAVASGFPSRILFAGGGHRGFVLLETGQIGVFDPLADRWLYWLPAPNAGVLDVAVTPDGSRVVVLGRESDPSAAGMLWIYDVERAVDAPPGRLAIDFLEPTGAGRILAASDDSRLLYLRAGKSSVGEYNFETGEYQDLKLNEQFPYCTVRDIQVFDSCLAMLLTLPDESGFVCVCNTQMHLYGTPIPTGRNPVSLDVFSIDTGPLAAVLCRSADGAADMIRFVHLFENRVVASISGLIPPGVRDFAVNDARDDGVILYVPGGEASSKGYVGFFDRRTLSLRDEYAIVPVDAGSRILLSRSPIINRCYIWTSGGTISVIDLDRHAKVEMFELNAESLASPAENT